MAITGLEGEREREGRNEGARFREGDLSGAAERELPHWQVAPGMKLEWE